MIRRMFAVFVFVAATLSGQGTPPPPGTISGVIRDIGTKEPVAGAIVFISGPPGSTAAPSAAGRAAGAVLTTTTADDNGNYTLTNVPPGRQNVQVRAPNLQVETPYGIHMSAGATAHRMVQLSPGQNLPGFDIAVDSGVTITAISGRVLDEDDEPVAGVTVRLIRVEYQLGVLRYFRAGRAAKTNDQGRYELRVTAGVPFVVMASSRADYGTNAASGAPADPQRRKQVYIPAFFPNSRVIEGAERIVLRAGEVRDRQDIRIATSVAYCADGLLTAAGSAAQMSFHLDEPQPTDSLNSASSYAGFQTGADGKFRVCDLHPGLYQLTSSRPSLYGAADVAIVEQDLHGVKLDAGHGFDIPGEMVWDGTAPTPLATPGMTVMLNGATGIQRPSAALQQDGQGNAVPGPFLLQNINPGKYQAILRPVPKGAYLKDAVYGPVSVLRRELHFTGGDAHLTMTLAWDGGMFSATVQDKDGNPVSDAVICLMPVTADSEANLQADLVQGKTDLDGTYTSGSLRPGKYRVLAVSDPILPDPESIHRLWEARSRGKEIEIAPSASSQLTLDVTSLQ